MGYLLSMIEAFSSEVSFSCVTHSSDVDIFYSIPFQ